MGCGVVIKLWELGDTGCTFSRYAYCDQERRFKRTVLGHVEKLQIAGV